MAPTSPTVARWELIRRLRERRQQLGLDAAVVSKAVSISPANWSHVESDRRMLTEEKLRIMCDLLEIDDEERDLVFELRAIGKRRGWWQDYSALFSGELLRFYGLEYGAESVRTYDSVLVPGLLQTADYAHALIASDTTFIPQAQVKQRVEVRVRRQQRLTDDEPLQLTAVVSEAALRQQIGGRDVLRGQLRHLADMLEKHPTVDIRFIPFGATGGIHSGATFYLLDFASTILPTMGWYESPGPSGLLEDSNTVQALEITHELAQNSALSREDSFALVREQIRTLG
ncbi:helix-turn-helix domain-containing protein [Nocardia terpenica]|uniref:Transcriptional regulator n=1 Tax=Nocardia terpenica TaxID=455432 RepID=A0A291RYC4_9NOCA|nr:helix-turn-helix transcriptional regulator [Nocardia terpenica]ATL72279.1 transcriptional regulator [Nocardia terpenica]